MRLSLFIEVPCDEPDDPFAVKRRIDQALEQCAYADQLGFHAVNVVEHHFLPGYSHMSCPEQFLVAAAARTKRLRLRHAIMHLPFTINHPIRIAEHIAMLDILSGGRAEFGGGRSTTAEELLGFGVQPADTQAQWEECLRMLPKMWTEDVFEWDSPLIKIPPRRIIPKPIQKPFPPMWAACSRPFSAEFAGRNGLGAMGLGIAPGSEKSLTDIYKDAIATAKPEHGVINDQMGTLQPALCMPTDDEALAIQEGSIRIFSQQLNALFAPWVENTPPTYERNIEHTRRQLLGEAGTPAIAGATTGLVGSPEKCAATLNRMTANGYDEVFLFMQMIRTPHEKVMESIQLFAERVRPLLVSKEDLAPSSPPSSRP